MTGDWTDNIAGYPGNPPYKAPQMEPCSRCGGYGLVTNMIGEVDDCTECGGGGIVEARDERGRFLPWVWRRDSD